MDKEVADIKKASHRNRSILLGDAHSAENLCWSILPPHRHQGVASLHGVCGDDYFDNLQHCHDIVRHLPVWELRWHI